MNPFDPERFSAELFSPHLNAEAATTALWQYQRTHNPVMRRFARELGVDGPVFIPIEFFKHFPMKTGAWEAEAVFASSGTTGQTPSLHHVRDLAWYRRVSRAGFRYFFPDKPFRILALLPSYLERGNSSLVRMVRDWMEDFGLPGSDFFLHDFTALARALREAAEAGQPILLIGVAFALLDFAAQYPMQLPQGTLLIETGGMKGRGEELTRQELHQRLRSAFGLPQIVSEYGMTELLSQAYALREGRFHTPPWLHVIISDIHLGSLRKAPGQSGRINLIDLANIHSCAFIATDDLGRAREDGSFEVLGRLEQSEIRGCNLMYL
jgi:hypothetical protein